MTKAEMRLAGYFLQLAADEFSNHGCNDLDSEAVKAFGGTEAEKRKLSRECMEQRGFEEQRIPFEKLMDHELMSCLAEKLKAAGKE
jgi:hypothetical protein